MISQRSIVSIGGGWCFAAGILAGLCLLVPAPAAYGKNDRVSQLVVQLRYPDPIVRKEAIGQMAKLKDPRALKYLIGMLRDEDRGVRETAANALGEMKGEKAERAVRPLVATLRDPDPYVRAWADTALIKIGAPSVEPLIQVLKDKDFYVPALAALALSQIKDSRASSALVTVVNEHNLKAILGIHTYLIKLGSQSSESALVETFSKYPSMDMAEEFANCGNPALQAAAAAWAQKVGRTLGQTRPAAAVHWGGGA
jgi:HEAT repeat protein